MRWIVLCLLIAVPVLANARTYGDLEGVQYHTCYDGDTCTFSLPGVHPLIGDHISVRVLGLDTPEFRGKCDSEKALAPQARHALRDLLQRAQRIDLREVQRVKYFRFVARVEADGVGVAAVLITRVFHGRVRNRFAILVLGA